MLLALSLLACTSPDALTVTVPADQEAAFTDFVAFLDWDDATLAVDDTPQPRSRGLEIGVVLDQDCDECWLLEPVGRDDWLVHAGDSLGAQYGVAEVLEAHGFRFHHPFRGVRPASLDPVDIADAGTLRVPEVARRGLQLHTLHPVEGLFDAYMPSADGQERTARVVDWLVKNRGDHVQWLALYDIYDPTAHAAWVDHSATLLDRAHDRGVTVGIGVQLYGAASLQHAYVLLDDVGTLDEQRAAIRGRLEPVLRDDLPWDLVALSFGEFFDAEPEDFLASTQLAVDEMHALSPDLVVAGKVHVGADLVVEYQGEELPYYFLAQYVEGLTPWVHTVMYYNLFDDPGGSYGHEDYDAHRELLLDRIEAGEPVCYFPESAYWVAFDNSVPTYLPVYMRSRWEDLDGIEAAGVGALPEQVLFSSGWEWGYWQTDVAVLRGSFHQPDHWADPIREELAVHDQGSAVADVVQALGDAQYDVLVGERAAAWLAGVDAVIELGATQGIVAQPLRPSYAELHGWDAERLADDGVALEELLAELHAIHADALADYAALGVGRDDPFLAEIEDGLAVDVQRAAFQQALVGAVLASARGEDPSARLDAAEAAYAAGQEVVARRHGALHYPEPGLLLDEDNLPTLYTAGYLHHADTLCFWERERAQVRNLLLDEGLTVPGCVR